MSELNWSLLKLDEIAKLIYTYLIAFFSIGYTNCLPYQEKPKNFFKVIMVQ